MRHLLNVCGIATAAIALAAVMPSAIAQESTFTYTCQTVGTAPPEPLGDREGHAISVSENSCRADLRPVCRRRRDRHDHLGMGQDKRCRGLRQQRHPQAGRHSGVKGHRWENLPDGHRRQSHRLDKFGPKHLPVGDRQCCIARRQVHHIHGKVHRTRTIYDGSQGGIARERPSRSEVVSRALAREFAQVCES